MKYNSIKYFVMVALFLPFITPVTAQLNTIGSMYFQNPYIGNPAMVGIQSGYEVGGAYKTQWTTIDGAPSIQALTATYGTEGEKAGFGVYLYNEHAGILRTTSFKASYAYHIKLNSQTDRLDFGLSLGGSGQWLDINAVKGDITEEILTDFNKRKIKLQSDFGMAFRSRTLTVQAAFPNLNDSFEKKTDQEVVDRFLAIGIVKYKIFTPKGIFTSVEPMAGYRMVANYKDLYDAGVNLQLFEDKLQVSSIYHSTNAVTFGLGTTYQNQLSILCQYTTNTANLQRYSNGEFEMGLKYRIN